MITKNELQRRVSTRKQELEAAADKLTAFKNKVSAFVDEIKSRSAIYALVKNLKLWKELEALIKDGDSSG